jgi:hypothetical protein
MTDDLLRSIDARLKRVEATLAALLAPKRSKSKRHRDPKFPRIASQSMEEKGLSQSDLAALIWGRYTNTEGKFVARGRDRISRWLAGLDYPSAKNMAKLAQFIDVV